jgi:hypothetical protein
MEIEPIDRGLLDQPLARYRIRRAHFFIQQQQLISPNIPGAVSAMSPFNEYMNELELEATSEDDICAGVETLNAMGDGATGYDDDDDGNGRR